MRGSCLCYYCCTIVADFVNNCCCILLPFNLDSVCIGGELLKTVNARIVFLVAGVAAGFLLSAVIHFTTGFTLFGKPDDISSLSAKASNGELIELGFQVIEAMQNGDFREISQIVHPKFGVVFSPYATINFNTNQCFFPEQVALFGSDRQLYVWGVYLGSGEPIELSVADYVSEFVLDRDYSLASVIGVNNIVRSGNALENITEVGSGVRFVDFHIPGSDKNGSDSASWSSLRLGFEEHDGSLWLTVILHSKEL